MADQKHTAANAPSTKAQPPKPPEVVRRVVTDDTTAAPVKSSVPPPVPTAAVFTPTEGSAVATEAPKDTAERLTKVIAANGAANAALDAEIERVKALIKAKDDITDCPADKMSRDEKLALFRNIFAIEKRINDAKAVAEAAGLERTHAVLALITAYGGKLGKWTVDGVGLKARIRGDGAYLMRPDEEEADVI